MKAQASVFYRCKQRTSRDRRLAERKTSPLTLSRYKKKKTSAALTGRAHLGPGATHLRPDKARLPPGKEHLELGRVRLHRLRPTDQTYGQVGNLRPSIENIYDPLETCYTYRRRSRTPVAWCNIRVSR